MQGAFKKNSEGVVINKDTSGYEKFLSERASRKKMAALENEVQSLKGDISEVKDLLKQLIKGN